MIKPSLPTLPTFPTYLTYHAYLTYLTYLTSLQFCLKHRALLIHQELDGSFRRHHQRPIEVVTVFLLHAHLEMGI